jgi:phosphatidylinositol 4-kinase
MPNALSNVYADPSHLLITRPTQSNALESFVISRCEESTHSAMLVSLSWI